MRLSSNDCSMRKLHGGIASLVPEDEAKSRSTNSSSQDPIGRTQLQLAYIVFR